MAITQRWTTPEFSQQIRVLNKQLLKYNISLKLTGMRVCESLCLVSRSMRWRKYSNLPKVSHSFWTDSKVSSLGSTRSVRIALKQEVPVWLGRKRHWIASDFQSVSLESSEFIIMTNAGLKSASISSRVFEVNKRQSKVLLDKELTCEVDQSSWEICFNGISIFPVFGESSLDASLTSSSSLELDNGLSSGKT